MKKLIFILIIGLCTSCNDAGVTELEKQAVQSVLDVYGGICYRSKGFVTENDQSITYFHLTMAESAVLERDIDKTEMPASNIAYLFYTNLGEEKANYDAISVTVRFKNRIEKNFKYSVKTLELVSKRMRVANKVVELLTNKDYEKLKTLLNNEQEGFDKDQLIANLIKFDPQFGAIKEFMPFGFKVHDMSNGMDILHISGALIREIQNSEFSIEVDLNSEKEEIFLLDYSL